MGKASVVIHQDVERPVERHVLANAIVAISSAVRQLKIGGITFEAIVVLTHHNCKPPFKNGTKPSLSDVRAVLESLGELSQQYTT